MFLTTALLINNLCLFILEVTGHHVCHSVVMLLNGYYHLCQAMLCTVRIVSRRIQFTYTSRHTYGLARVGVVGELVAFISFLSLSISVFLESLKHLIDVIFILPKRESNSTTLFTAHGHEHIHSLIDHPNYILGIGIYATVSNLLLGIAILYKLMKRVKKFNKELTQRGQHLQQPLQKKLLSKSLLVSDTLPAHHSFLQVFNMLLGSVAILICGILLILLSEKLHVRIIYSRLVDPIMCCLLFLSYAVMIYVPIRDAMHLVLQAKPNDLRSDEIETEIITCISGVVKIHQFHVWRLTPQKTLATIHIVFNTTKDLIAKYQSIYLIFKAHHIDNVTIQPEFKLSSDEIQTLACNHKVSGNEKECSTLRLTDKPTVKLANPTNSKPLVSSTLSSSSSNKHFHRRSSVGLHSVDSDSETTE